MVTKIHSLDYRFLVAVNWTSLGHVAFRDEESSAILLGCPLSTLFDNKKISRVQFFQSTQVAGLL